MNLNHQLRSVGGAFLAVFYPDYCQLCQTELNLSEKHLCLSCSYDLPYIVQSESALQTLHKLFWGRTTIQHIYSLLDYKKGNQVQTLLHQLKYHKRTKLGAHLGQLLGDAMPKEVGFDAIVPVPLHPKKLRKRGFNQSEVIAKGIAAVHDLPLRNDLIKRVKHNASQTKFTKYDRWENVRSIFAVKKADELKNKHILLVDDVLTTGATIEACVNEMITVENCTVSIATLAARL